MKPIKPLVGTPLFIPDNFQTMTERINELIERVNILTDAAPTNLLVQAESEYHNNGINTKPEGVSPSPDTISIRRELLRQKYSVIHMALKSCDKQMKYYRDNIENNPGSWNIVMNETHKALEDFKKLKEEGKI